ncbi:MAG TPA: hypothetical protein VKX16_15400, partial [Chloroflexota bacterium]|nr:hypothetical protein [Chloroflexota bacterium]
MNAATYLEHLTDADLSLLVTTSQDFDSIEDLLAELRERPALLGQLLRQPRLFHELFSAEADAALLRASPFLAFAVLVHRTAQDLESAGFVSEWIGPGQRVPMFQV